MRTIDEAITHARELADYYKANHLKKEAEYHQQLAEWLEELKRLRENSNGYNKEDIELNRKAMYSKAIDDFAGLIRNRIEIGCMFTVTEIDKWAEQLKEGGKYG